LGSAQNKKGLSLLYLAIRPYFLFSLIIKFLPFKDIFSLYRDYLYVKLLFLAFLILTGQKVKKKTSPKT